MWRIVQSLVARCAPHRCPEETDGKSLSIAPEVAGAGDVTTADALFDSSLRRTYVDTDRLFAMLLAIQWLGGIILALVVSPRTWIGDQSQTHIHVWIAVFLGGAISSLPIVLVWKQPGSCLTRHVIAVAQMLWSALLVHLTGGRIETHFHVFGSLAFLAFYRDWRVLITATIVVAADHFVRGVWWPRSVFGVLVESPFRWIEHAAWVVFEDIILIRSCLRGKRECRDICEREAKLSAANKTLQLEIRERHRAEAEIRLINEDLAAAHEKAIEASQIKSQFLANMSHELRTPLNAIIGYSELLQILAQRREDTAYNADLERINKSGNHLLALINGLLDISKIEAGKLQLDIESFRVAHIIEDIRGTVDQLATKNENSFEVRIPADLGMIRSDAVRLKQCLLNLLSNACKFTHKGMVTLLVTAEAEVDSAWIVFEVRDTGIGLTNEQAGRLFQPFAQADASTTRKYGGTGLGLSITKSLCEAMGGSIHLKSRIGEGSSFTMRLPKQQQHRKPCLVGSDQERDRRLPRSPEDVVSGPLPQFA
jgi:two-component system, sensor histidine kinase and response regulator